MLYWTLLTLTVGVTTTTGYQYCYECSSKSALCRNFVYDGHYLTKTPCKSLCFYRNEDNRVYRGCFDGWLGGIVRSDYLGCRTQLYLGNKVEWCFCNGTNDITTESTSSQPCNGAHRDVIAQLGKGTVLVDDNPETQEQEQQEKLEAPEMDANKVLHMRSKHSLPRLRAPEGRGFIPEMISNDKGYAFPDDPGGRYEAEPLGEVADVEEVATPVVTTPAPQTTSPSPSPTPRQVASTAHYASLCAGRYDGTYADPTDCSRYLICTHGQLYRMRCSAGTLWEAGLQTCVFFAHRQYVHPCVLPKRFRHFQYVHERVPIEVYDLSPGDYNENYKEIPND